jgi:hypothetical protein
VTPLDGATCCCRERRERPGWADRLVSKTHLSHLRS